MGNSDVGGLSPGGLACICTSSIVEFPSPKGANAFFHHVSKSTFAIFGWLGGQDRKGFSL